VAKVTKKLSFQDIPKKIKGGFKAFRFKDVIDIIKDLIKKGISPVQGGGRFKRYSESYRDAIDGDGEIAKQKAGKKSPVDMTLTGEMMQSLDVKDRQSRVFIEFEDEKAFYHNTSGAGKSKVIRRLLPDREGERFSRQVQERIFQRINEIIKDALK